MERGGKYRADKGQKHHCPWLSLQWGCGQSCFSMAMALADILTSIAQPSTGHWRVYTWTSSLHPHCSGLFKNCFYSYDYEVIPPHLANVFFQTAIPRIHSSICSGMCLRMCSVLTQCPFMRTHGRNFFHILLTGISMLFLNNWFSVCLST